MQDIEARLEKIGLTLPQPGKAAANYLPYTISKDGTLYIAGQIPYLNGQEMHKGRLGDTLTVEQGQEAAKACALNILAQVKEAVEGDWSRVNRCLKLGGFVNATPDFNEHPAVINGASFLMIDAMGDAGKHARFAVGVSNLPFGVAVEIDAIFDIKL